MPGFFFFFFLFHIITFSSYSFLLLFKGDSCIFTRLCTEGLLYIQGNNG